MNVDFAIVGENRRLLAPKNSKAINDFESTHCTSEITKGHPQV